MKYKGLIFDFNGVLLWDSAFHEKAWNEMSQQLRNQPFSQEEMATHMHGRVGSDVLEYLTGRKLTKEEVEQLEDEKEQVYIKLCLENIKNYKLSGGAEELLNFLVGSHIPFTIATSSPKVLVDFYEERLNLSKWFDLKKIVYNDYSIPGKPAPDIYLLAAEKLNLLPKDCIVIEDAKSGVKAARTAGIGYIIALGSGEKHTELLKLDGVNEAITN
jgi:HAD superfamily hydrolase (TIGR01509 family)